jgi:histidyl-tRNA synthetase
MTAVKTQPARGMRDFLPADVRRREYVIGIIKEVYERYGFEPLETPAVENIETLMGKYGEEGNQLIFKILKRGEHERSGEADLALRYDLTVPLARVVAQYRNELPKFFKRYQIQPVWRADRPARGRFREFYQCDVDVLGSRSMVVEAELCMAASDVLMRLGFNDFTIRLNHRKVLEGQLDAWGVAPDEYVGVLTTLDKIEKIGIDGARIEFIQKGISESVAEEILNSVIWLKNFYDANRKLERWNEVVIDSLYERLDSLDNDAGRRGINELRRIVVLLKSSSAGSHIKIDPNLARGLSYYTGAIMEINVPDLAGSLGGGGRYDNLVGMFLGQSVPACGFSLGLERIIVVMTERDMFPENLIEAPAEVMVTIWDEGSITDSLRLATELRELGLRVDLYPEADKLGKQFKYASSRGINFVAVLGEEERKVGDVSLKDMRTGEQSRLPRERLAATVQEKLSGG